MKNTRKTEYAVHYKKGCGPDSVVLAFDKVDAIKEGFALFRFRRGMVSFWTAENVIESVQKARPGEKIEKGRAVSEQKPYDMY